eukprot:CAMPEP_0115710528 /NCGR_PEP_ID=MMETSP0272-20121206/73060_1 /TAXON_ID=71861 /ORGANISM="Scrippsiella trochoidea, Strain CCMP3099" /LENGTH=35 /DNA_ID= /DNA_START= /DNA_END= /DNA_ORIENTATION=
MMGFSFRGASSWPPALPPAASAVSGAALLVGCSGS